MSTGAPDLALLEAMRRSCDFLEKQGITYSLVGGLAVSIWTEPRTTFDVDFVVAVHEGAVDELLVKIRSDPTFIFEPESLSFPPATHVIRVHQGSPSLEVPGETAVIMVDFLMLSPSFTESLLSRRSRMEWRGMSFWICSPEDLIIMKLLAARAKDLLDATAVMISRGERLDRSYIEYWAEQLGCRQVLQRLSS